MQPQLYSRTQIPKVCKNSTQILCVCYTVLFADFRHNCIINERFAIGVLEFNSKARTQFKDFHPNLVSPSERHERCDRDAMTTVVGYQFALVEERMALDLVIYRLHATLTEKIFNLKFIKIRNAQMPDQAVRYSLVEGKRLTV